MAAVLTCLGLPDANTYHSGMATMPKLDPSAVAKVAGRLRANITAAALVSGLGLRGLLRGWLAMPPGGPAPLMAPRRRS
jgi:hypothetical protein